MNAETFFEILLPLWRSDLPSDITPAYFDGFIARKRGDILAMLEPVVAGINEKLRQKAERQKPPRMPEIMTSAERMEEERMGDALRGARDREEAAWAEAVDHGTAIEMELGLDAATARRTAIRNLAPDLGFYKRTLVANRQSDGAMFPTYEGELLSWSVGAYMTPSEENLGHPRARVVIQAMRRHRPEQLQKEHADLIRSSFDRMFGHNAKRELKLVEMEAPETILATTLLRNIKEQQSIVTGQPIEESSPVKEAPTKTPWPRELIEETVIQLWPRVAAVPEVQRAIEERSNTQRRIVDAALATKMTDYYTAAPEERGEIYRHWSNNPKVRQEIEDSVYTDVHRSLYKELPVPASFDESSLIAQAAQAGRRAFLNGSLRAPAMSTEYRDLLKGISPQGASDLSIKLSKAFLRAWDDENLKQPLPSEVPSPPVQNVPAKLLRLTRHSGGWNVLMTERVSKPDFISLLRVSKGLRGSYQSTPPSGFRFQREADARSFISQIDEIPDALIQIHEPPKAGLRSGWTNDPAILDRVRKLVADSERLEMKLPRQAAWLAKVLEQSDALPEKFRNGTQLVDFLADAEGKVQRKVARQPKAKQLRAEGGARQAKTDIEDAAADAVVSLAGMDPDRAREKNFAGFDKADGATGHAIAARIQQGGELTESEWDWARRALKKYRKQVGAPAPSREKTRAKKAPKLTDDELAAELVRRLKVFEYGQTAQFLKSKKRWEIGVDHDGKFYTSEVDSVKRTPLLTESHAARHLMGLLKSKASGLLTTLYPGYRLPVGLDVEFLEENPPTAEFFGLARKTLREIEPPAIQAEEDFEPEINSAEISGSTYLMGPLLRRAAQVALKMADGPRADKEVARKKIDQVNVYDVTSWVELVDAVKTFRGGYREAYSRGHEDPATIPELDKMVRALEERFTVERLRSGHGYRLVKLRTKYTWMGLPKGTDLVEVMLHFPRGSTSAVPTDWHELRAAYDRLGDSPNGTAIWQFRQAKQRLKDIIVEVAGEEEETEGLPIPDAVLDDELAAWERDEGEKERKLAAFTAKPRALYGPMQAYGGGTMFIHPDQKPGMWRQTRFDPKGEPIGHFGPASFRDVVVNAMYDGDIHALKVVDKKGTVEALPRKVRAELVVPADLLWRAAGGLCQDNNMDRSPGCVRPGAARQRLINAAEAAGKGRVRLQGKQDIRIAKHLFAEGLPTDPFRERGPQDSIVSKLRNLYYHNFGVDSKAILTVGRDHRITTGDQGRLRAEEFRLWAHKDGVPSDDPEDPVYWLWVLGRSDYAFLEQNLNHNWFDRLFAPDVYLYTSNRHHIHANPQMMRRLASFDPELIRPLLFTSHVSQRDLPPDFWTQDEREELHRTWVKMSDRKRLKLIQARLKNPTWRRLNEDGYTLSEVFPDVREEGLHSKRRKVPAVAVDADARAHLRGKAARAIPRLSKGGVPSISQSEDGGWELTMDVSAAEPYVDQKLWEQQGRNGNGYDWADIVRANIPKKTVAQLRFDPESQMLAVYSASREPVAAADLLLRRLLSSPGVLEDAIRKLPSPPVEGLPRNAGVIAEYDAIVEHERQRLDASDNQVAEQLATFIRQQAKTAGLHKALASADDFVNVWGETMHLRAHGSDAVPVLAPEPAILFLVEGRVYALRDHFGLLKFRDDEGPMENARSEAHNRYYTKVKKAEAFMESVRDDVDISLSRTSADEFLRGARKLWSRARERLSPITSRARAARP